MKFAATLGVIIGVISALLLIEFVPELFWIKNEPWKTNILMGSEAADIYTRAAVAKKALYVLNNSEAIYFIANTDSDGKRLNRDCEYIVKGKKLPARWWSITVYDEENWLIPNEYDIYSFTSVGAEENWQVFISKKPKSDNWIPLNGSGHFNIVLRLYNPEPWVYENLETIELPSIEGEC